MSKPLEAITRARQAIEKLVNETPTSDEFTLGQLGSILAELRSAERTIQNLSGELA
ncbi:MAG TPA: hypothetical protein VM260_22885 [Pirellula sp.]|nr:hypothetical protein [Pirellula sp.]